MAKQKKKRNKKYRQKYTTGGRLDMRNGGRVSLRHGGPHGLETMEVPEKEDEMSIDRLPALPRPDMMPIRLPEPMPMLPEPMPMRPRMPMPGPIATPMPMAPINLPKIELPKIERSEPMMPRRGGIGSFR